MVTSMIRRKDSLSMAELAKRFIAVALDTCTPPKLIYASKRRLILVKPTATFQSFMDSQKFGQLMKILKNKRFNLHAWLPDGVTAEKGESALHLIMKYNPPVEIVELLIQRLKQIRPETNPVTFQDEYGMTPLHVAVARSCDARVIELLVFGNGASADAKMVAGVADCHQRYPLHYICTIPTRIQNNSSGKNETSIFSDAVRIIRCLVVSFPAAVDSPDKNGWTPKHMAESLNADEKVLEILRNPSRAILVQLCPANLMKQSSVATPTTSCETEVLGLPFDEIICYRMKSRNDSDYDDDVSTIGWNTNFKVTTMSSNCVKSTKRGEVKKQIESLDLSINEINFDVSKLKMELSRKYRFI